MDTNDYLARVYPSPPCWALVSDVYGSERGARVKDFTPAGGSIREVMSAFRLAVHDQDFRFERIDLPEDYCLVMLSRRPGGVPSHCGVWYAGRVLHAVEAGVVYQDVASLRDKWPQLEFWRLAE